MNKAPIVPCTIVGAEESHLNLGNIDLSRFMKDIRIPIPLNLIPLPAKWKIRFWDPIDPSRYPLELANQKNEIENFGDTVRIIKEPTITVSSYARGSVINPQDLADDQITLVVDQANAFAFKITVLVG